MSRERPVPDRPLYCGNYEYEMLETEIRRLFEKYGDVDRIDMKTGSFCFVYMKDDRDAEDAMRKLDGRSVGRRGRPLRVQWAKTRDADRQREVKPCTTLFVVNFDVGRTRERDIERHFEPYGRIKRVEIKKAYAFVQYEALEDAEYALKKTHLSNLDGRTITVRYSVGEPHANESGGRGSPQQDYGRGHSPVGRDQVEYVQNEDPGAARGRGRDDDYGSGYGRRRSPVRSPVRSRSPVGRGRSRSRSPLDRERGRSPVERGARSPAGDRDREREREPQRGRSPADRGRSPADRARSYSR